MSGKRFCLGNHLSLWLCLLTVVPGSALFSGCGRSGREAIEGVVTLDGKPLEKGCITFRPQSGTASPSAGANITDGKFSVAPEGGLLPGKFHVEITASRVTNRKIRDRLTRNMVMLEEQYLPQKYNTNTQLEITIPPGSPGIVKNFDLTD